MLSVVTNMSAAHKIQTWPKTFDDVIQRSLIEVASPKKTQKPEFGTTWTSSRNTKAIEDAYERWQMNKSNHYNSDSDYHLHNHSRCNHSFYSDSDAYINKSVYSLKSSTGTSSCSSSAASLTLDQPLAPRRNQSYTPLEMVDSPMTRYHQPQIDFDYQEINYLPF